MISKVRIIAVGKVKEAYIREGINEFAKRLGPFCRFEIIELKDEGKDKESEKLEKYVDNTSFLLDAGGKDFSSEEFAEMFKKNEGTMTFIIGGHDGFSDKLKKSARRLSLSRMTFPHEMCRLFLTEQIYRSFMIINNRQYHR